MINDLVVEVYNTACSKGWHDKTPEFGTQIALVHSELSEALEYHRSGLLIAETRFVDGKPYGIPVELADVVIRIFDICGNYGIDLENAIRMKMDYNKTRPYKHGGKIV